MLTPRARAETAGDSGGSGIERDHASGGVIRPTALPPSQVTPAMMLEFMAKFGSMQAMAAKIEQLETKVAGMKLVRPTQPYPTHLTYPALHLSSWRPRWPASSLCAPRLARPLPRLPHARAAARAAPRPGVRSRRVPARVRCWRESVHGRVSTSFRVYCI